MFRYVAFVWNRAGPAQTAATAQRLATRLQATSEHWSCALERPGVRVYYAGERPTSTGAHVLHGDGGVVFGTLFSGAHDTLDGTVPAKAVLNVRTSARVIATGGRALISDGYWGNYVAVVHDSHRNTVWVIRGPASSLPCLCVTYQQIQVCFSFMEDCVRLGLSHFSVDWDYVAQQMITPVSGERTGLQEVSQLLPGECIEVAYGRISKHVYWDALEIARTNIIEDVDEAASKLRRTVKACVHAWAACYESIMHNLSGGLDSSIVLACLQDAPTRPRITCVTEYSPGPDSDERDYARLAARSARCHAHIEQRRNASVRLEGMLDAIRWPIPQGYFRRAETTHSQAQLARQCEANAIFSGSGGDQVFCQSGARLSVADFVHRHGVGSRLVRVAYDGAQLEGLSLWRILRYALYAGLVPHQYDFLSEALQYRTLVSEEVVNIVRAKPITAPQHQSTRHVPPGKLSHIHGLSFLDDYYDPIARAGYPEQVAPLFSQPIIEIALRIPTYVLMGGGWDRGLARRAFAGELPVEIARRRSKGGMADHTLDILRANLPFARGLLFDGLLVQNGLLDRTKVADVLADRPSGVMKGLAEICDHLSTEVWLRMWTSNRSTRLREAAAGIGS